MQLSFSVSISFKIESIIALWMFSVCWGTLFLDFSASVETKTFHHRVMVKVKIVKMKNQALADKLESKSLPGIVVPELHTGKYMLLFCEKRLCKKIRLCYFMKAEFNN